MFQVVKPKRGIESAAFTAELIFHSVVRKVRTRDGNAVIAIVTSIIQMVLMMVFFYYLNELLGGSGSAIRGDRLLFILSGVFLFITNTKTLAAVAGSETPTSSMLKHAPLNTFITIFSAALTVLYTQVLSVSVIMFVYYLGFNQFVVDRPMAAIGMLFIAWFNGLALGIILLALKPWFPRLVGIFTTLYKRVNMIASGKMFTANSLPSTMLAMFDWNPLFHTIDQARGFVFINYTPHFTSIEYPAYIGIVMLMIGLMIEFYTRKNVSVSWYARR